MNTNLVIIWIIAVWLIFIFYAKKKKYSNIIAVGGGLPVSVMSLLVLAIPDMFSDLMAWFGNSWEELGVFIVWFIAVWLIFIFYAKKKKYSNIIAVGGGLAISIISLLVFGVTGIFSDSLVWFNELWGQFGNFILLGLLFIGPIFLNLLNGTKGKPSNLSKPNTDNNDNSAWINKRASKQNEFTLYGITVKGGRLPKETGIGSDVRFRYDGSKPALPTSGPTGKGVKKIYETDGNVQAFFATHEIEDKYIISSKKQVDIYIVGKEHLVHF